MVGAVVGAKTQGGPISYAGVAEFETVIGRKLAIDSHFVGWDFSGLAVDKLDAAAGRIPLIAWKLQDSGLTARDVTSGRLDAHIRDVGGQLAQIPGRVLLRFMDEMNIHPELGTPSQVIAAWKHVRHIIHPLAPRVEWVQCLTARAVTAGTAQAYYVGPRYCDWLAVDGYNLYPNAGGWVMPDRIFDAFYSWAAPLGKPLMIAEVGTTNDPADPTRMADWILALDAWIEAHPLVSAWVYTHSWSAEGNFRVDQTPEALAAYKAVVNAAYMQ